VRRSTCVAATGSLCSSSAEEHVRGRHR
jgi:hypothetical protein